MPPHEHTASAAHRRLFEEMGIKTPLIFIEKFYYQTPVINYHHRSMIEHEIDYVFVGQWQNDTITLNEEEASQYKWVELQTLHHCIKTTPEMYTPWLEKVIAIVTHHMSSRGMGL